MAAHYISYWRDLCRNVHNYYLVGVLQQIVDNCVGGADEDLGTLQACVTELTPEVLSQQQSQEEEEEEEEEKEPSLPEVTSLPEVVSLQENKMQNEWEGLWLHNNQQQQQSSDDTQLLDHVSSDYVITQDSNEPAVLLPTDTIDQMGVDVSVVTKSSGAILIESPLLPEVSHELKEVPLSSHDTLDKSHDQIDGSHEPREGSHEFIQMTNEPLEVIDDSVDKSHELMQGSREPVNGSHDPLNESHGRSCDQLTSQEQVTELNLESHDLFGESHDLTEPLFDDEESGTYRHRSLTAASVSNAPYISLASANGRQDNSFEAIPLTTGSKKKKAKKSGKKKKKQQSSSSATIAPPLDVQPPAEPPVVQDEQLPTPPVKSEY